MTVMEKYRLLLAEIDSWFSRCQLNHREAIVCNKGCSECCRGLFDITILDAALLNIGFAGLPDSVRVRVREKAEKSIRAIQSSWPEFEHPFILNHRPEDEMETLMATDNETPCVLLDAEGKCLLYDYRPMTCRLHGLPLIDFSGEVMEGEWKQSLADATLKSSSEKLSVNWTRLFHQRY
jgi:Fe-S-cluster containining protein